MYGAYVIETLMIGVLLYFRFSTACIYFYYTQVTIRDLEYEYSTESLYLYTFRFYVKKKKYSPYAS